MLESVDSQDELQQALKDPETFLKNLLAGAGGKVAKKLLLHKLKPHLEPYLEEQSLTWADVQPALSWWIHCSSLRRHHQVLRRSLRSC